MNKGEKTYLVDAFMRLACSTLLTELIFRAISFESFFSISLFRIILFTLGVDLLISGLTSFLPVKAGRMIVNIIMWFFSSYALVQAGMKNFAGSYLSVGAMGEGAGRVSAFVPSFLGSLGYRWVLLLPPAVSIIAFHTIPHKTESRKVILISLAAAVIVDLAGLGTVYDEQLEDSYYHPQFPEQTIQKFGIGRYLLLDLFGDHSSVQLLAEDSPAEPVETTAGTAGPEPSASTSPSAAPRTREDDLDDSAWREEADAETDPEMQQIDTYLLNRDITDYDDYTGMFQGKNVIYIMIEAFCYVAIDPDLTPTLQMIKDQGWEFTNHYTPIFSCATGESELVSEVSLAPVGNACTINAYDTNQWNDSIFHQYRRAGYSTQAYHNWKDEFYERRIVYSNSDIEKYENYDDLPFKTVQGWQSDEEMMELTIPEWIDSEEPFFTFYVTSTTHFPYDQDSVIGNRYLDQVNEVHPDYDISAKRYLSKAIELDKAMKYLLDQLEEHDKLDDTLIVMYADHHPVQSMIPLLQYYVKDVNTNDNDGFNIDRTPFLMYGAGIEPQKFDMLNSTFDIAPTVMNLSGIDYDPRIYIGKDVFAGGDAFIPYPNGSWITVDGVYNTEDSKFTPFEGKEEKNEEYIERYNTLSRNLYSVSSMIFSEDYFRKRKSAAEPVYQKKE